MREAIGGTWVTQLVIVFMLIFVAFLALSLNYTKAFKVKNQLMTIIEQQEGVTSGDNGSIAIMNNYLKGNAYGVMRACEIDSYGVSNLNSSSIERVTSNSKKYYYCIKKIAAPSSNHEGKVYYKVNIFFQFNLPVLGDLFTFGINGSTGDVVNPADNLCFSDGTCPKR